MKSNTLTWTRVYNQRDGAQPWAGSEIETRARTEAHGAQCWIATVLCLFGASPEFLAKNKPMAP